VFRVLIYTLSVHANCLQIGNSRTRLPAETLTGNDFKDNLPVACITLPNLAAIAMWDQASFQNLSLPVFDPAALLAHP
jgi:hypothetical protein